MSDFVLDLRNVLMLNESLYVTVWDPTTNTGLTLIPNFIID